MSSDDTGIRSFGPKRSTSSDPLEKLTGATTEKAESSQQADTDDHHGPEWYRPPYPPEQLAALMERSEAHAACVTSKARNVCGYGLNAAPADGNDQESPPGEDTVRDFWHGLDTTFQLGPDRQPATAPEVLEHAWQDFESIGYLVLELLVNSSTGEPTGLAHIPAHTIRKLKDQRGYVQLDDGIEVGYFGEAGDRYDNADGEQWFINAETGTVGGTTGEVGGPEQVANELIVIRNYSALAPHYGTPDIVPALETLNGDLSARKWNAKVFENDTVPRMAVVVEGGELSDESWEQLQTKFQEISLEENTHRGVLIEAQSAASAVGDQQDVSIRLEPLTVGVDEDADFLEYRSQNRRDILRAHDVPPVIIGDTDSVNYANAQSQRVEFAQSTVRPKQERLSERIYQIVHVLGLGVDGWTIDFELRNGENDERQAEVARQRIEGSMGALTINEAREELGKPPLTDGEGNELPQGQQLLASLQQGAGAGGGGGPSPDDVASAVERARSAQRAEEHGYSITARKGSVEKDSFSEGDVVEYDGDTLGVVVEKMTDSFTVPEGDEGEREVDASSEDPVYVVARETQGFGVFEESDLSSGSIPDSEQGDPSELAPDEEASMDKQSGWRRLPDGWTRLTLLDAWSSMGGSFSGCSRHMADDIADTDEFCGSMKDEVLGTTRWRGRF